MYKRCRNFSIAQLLLGVAFAGIVLAMGFSVARSMWTERRSHSNVVVSVGFTASGEFLMSGDLHGMKKVWALPAGRLVESYNQFGDVWCKAFSKDGQTHYEDSGALWTITGSDLRSRFILPSYYPRFYALSPDAATLASLDTNIEIWDIPNQVRIRRWSPPFQVSTRRDCVAFSPDSRILASTNDSGNLSVYELRTGKELSVPISEDEAVVVSLSVAFSPDGKLLASGNAHDAIQLWNVATNGLLKLVTLKGRSGSVSSLAFSPDGSMLASGSSDGRVTIWDVRQGRELRTLSRYGTAPVLSIAFSPDGQTLASGGASLDTWEVGTGRHMARLSRTDSDRRRIAWGLYFAAFLLWVAAWFATWCVMRRRTSESSAVTINQHRKQNDTCRSQALN